MARRALALARSGVTADHGRPVILAFAGGDRTTLELARSRVLAVVDADPKHPTAPVALDMLDGALRSASDSAT